MTTEALTWIPIADQLPDADLTVLIALDEEHDEPTWFAFYEGDRWLDISGLPLRGVTHWAEMPKGTRP